MKNAKLLFILLAVVIASCSTDSEEVITQADLTLDVNTKTAILTELETALTAEKGELVKYESSEVLEIEGNMFLRAWSGDYVTTALLVKGKDGALRSSVSCTTSACAHIGSACRPTDENTCTPCTGGDCTRTVTSGDGLAEIAAF